MSGDCERVLRSVMARMDGEVPELAEAEEAAHLAACPGCRDEAAALHAVCRAFDGRRPEAPPPICAWPEIAARLAGSPPIRARFPVRHPVLLFGGFALVLVACRLLEVAPGFAMSLWTKSLPIVSAALLVSLLGDNPLRIRLDLSG